MDLDGEDASDACLLLGDDETPAVPPSLMCSAPVMDLCFHPQLPILAAGLVTGEVEIYECTDQETIKKPMQNDFGSWIFGPNKTYSEQDDIVLNYHHQNMRMHPSGGISSMEFTDDGVYLVSASSDRTISVMDCVSARLVIHINASQMESLSEKSKKKLKTPVPSRRKPLKRGKKGAAAMEVVNPHKHGVSALNVCDENLIATGDDDGLIAIWDMRERRPVHTYHEHADYVSQLCYFTDVAELVSSSGDTCLGVYDLRGARIRDFSEKRKDEISCFAFINASGANSSSFIPSILCGTPTGTLPMWKYGSWRRPYDAMEYHPKECESIISFHGEDTAFNHNLVLTGACDGLVRVIQMYPLRRNLCQLSARDYSYNHANSSTGSGGSGSSSYHNSNFITKKKRGHEGIRHMRLRHDSRVLAVSGTDNIVDFVDVRFLTDEKMLDELRGKAERRHMTTIRNMEREKAETEERERLAAEAGSDDSDDDDDDDDDSSSDDGSSSSSSDDDDDGNMAAKFARREVARKAAKRATAKVVDDARPTRKTKKAPATEVAAAPERTPDDYMEEIKLDRQTKRERVAAAKWLKLEKKKKIHFGFEKRRRRVGGFFGDMANGGGE